MNEPNPSFGLDAAASATSEIKKSITEMVIQFNDLKCEVKSKLESQENDMNAIERKNSAYSRPKLASSALEQDPHHSAFGAYVLGLAFAFGWTPCIGPQLGAILSLAASEASVTRVRQPPLPGREIMI